MINTALKAAANKIMSNTAAAQFIINAHFISAKEGDVFSFYPIFLDEIVINRNYADNFADEIDMFMRVSGKDYALMFDQGQDLRCIITITYVNKYGKIVFEPAPIQRQYRVMINDAKDLRKSTPDIDKYTSPDLDMSVRLIEETVYKLRHNKINAIFQVATIKEAIYSISQDLGIERVHLVDPDNDHRYDHVKVGSYQSISSVYGFLQSAYGVYTKGINSYITEGCLFVYPPFDTDPVYDKTLMIYQVDPQMFTGTHIFHRVENESVSLVVNSKPESFDLSTAGAENIGTGFIFNRASTSGDGITTTESGEPEFRTEPALMVTLQDSRTIDKDANNLFHIKNTDNPYPAMSELISHHASLMTFNWMNADPFVLDPCFKIIYYYDKNEVMVSRTGIQERAVYRLKYMRKMDAQNLYGCVGAITVRLSPNEKGA